MKRRSLFAAIGAALAAPALADVRRPPPAAAPPRTAPAGPVWAMYDPPTYAHTHCGAGDGPGHLLHSFAVGDPGHSHPLAALLSPGPRGMLAAYASVAHVPPHWRVCDGTHGTPDLRGGGVWT